MPEAPARVGASLYAEQIQQRQATSMGLPERTDTVVQRVITLITDDISGEQGDDIATHVFSIDGISYEIDLGADNYDKLLEAMGPFVSAGRKISGSRRGQGKRAQASGAKPDPVKVREWAKAQGIEVSMRGRVPKDVVEKYEAAH
ncbi:Lsr2 family protein [Streptomyces sp. NPDC001922]|uniref:histone-like nucleoid-structuring protein Lsr2 n=1 Tax=Streptomyces sp. NPDC001922 TaxID=3364624 RepID=UPI003676B778